MLRKTRATPCLDRCRMACSLQTILGQVQLRQHLASFVFGKVPVAWSTFPDVFLHPQVDIREVTEVEDLALVGIITVSHSLCSVHLLIWLPSLISAHCRCHIKCRTIHGCSNDYVVPVGNKDNLIVTPLVDTPPARNGCAYAHSNKSTF